MIGFILMLVLIFASLGLFVASGVWIFRDAERRGKPGLLVMALALIVAWPVSLLVWIALRPEPRAPKFDLNRFRQQ